MPDRSTPIVALSGVSKDYGERVVHRVLHGVDLTLAPGELVALVGPSGSGKSTLLNLVGLLDRPTEGAVHVAGHDTRGLDDAALTALRGRTLGFVFQFHHLLPSLRAWENVAVPLAAVDGRLRATHRERALTLLERVGLARHAHKRPDELSGGEQQRVAIARALAQDPPLVLADEPTGNLDRGTGGEVFSFFEELHGTLGTSFLVVTHDERIAGRCRRRVELVDGRVVRDG